MGRFSWLFGGGVGDDPPPKTETNYRESGSQGKPVLTKSSVYSGNDENNNHEHVYSKTYQAPDGTIRHEEGFAGKDAERSRGVKK